jgi:hypothetical protein
MEFLALLPQMDARTFGERLMVPTIPAVAFRYLLAFFTFKEIFLSSLVVLAILLVRGVQDLRLRLGSRRSCISSGSPRCRFGCEDCFVATEWR